MHVKNRQISATRNAGGREAAGDVFVFVDADTLANADAVRDVLAALAAVPWGAGVCSGSTAGCRSGRLTYPIGIRLFRLLNVVGGCFMFCTRAAFEATGGFSEEHFAAEELAFTKRSNDRDVS